MIVKERRGRFVADRKAIVLLEEQYQELEVWYPYLRFREAGIHAYLVAPEKGKTYPSKVGYPAVSDLAAAEVDGADYDAVVIPGGWSPDFMRRHPDMVNIVRRAHDAGKVVAAICHGGWMLASADILQGRKITCFFAIKDDLIHAGAVYVDAEVMVDGNLITSRIPSDLPVFMKTILQQLES